MKNSKKTLAAYSWGYVGLAVLSGVLILACFIFPYVAKNVIEVKMKDINIKGMSPKEFTAISYATEAAIYLWYFWLLRRVASGKSKGTFVMVLLFLSVVSGVIDQFRGFNVTTMLSIMINMYVVNLVYNIRNKD